MNWESISTTIFEFFTESGAKLIGAVLIVLVGFKLSKLLTNVMKHAKLLGKLDATARSFFTSFTGVMIKILVLITAAATLGVPMASMVTVIGSAGLAVGLALQGSLSNIAGGFIILVFKPFVVGDFVVLGEYSGYIHGINIFYTKMYTMDNKKIMIPNSKISSETLVDVSALPTRRVDLNFTASYDADIDEVKDVLLSAADKHPLVLKEPAPFARLCEHESSALKFELRVWCETQNYWDVHYDLLEIVKKSFDENDIEIPYQQLDVNVKR